MGDLRPQHEERFKFMNIRLRNTKLPKSELNNTCLSQLSVSGSGKRWSAPEPRQVSLPRTDPNLKKWTGLSTLPLVVLTERDWLMGAGPELPKCFDLPLTILGLDPELWTSPWSPHHYRLNRLPYLTAMHRDQPQIKSWNRWERGAGSPLTFKMDKGFFVA